MRFSTLVGLALRELWFSYRLLAVLGALLVAALPVTLLPPASAPHLAGAPLDPLAWHATAVAGALTLAAAIAAGTLSAELRRGTFAWLAVRAVPRASILLAWFAAFAVVQAIGLALAATIAAVSLGAGEALSGGLAAFVVANGAVAAAGMAATAIGLLLGAFLPPLAAMSVTLLVVGAALLGAAIGPLGLPPLPTGGLALLAGIDTETHPIAGALRSSGTALAVAASLLVLARARLERVDL
jgi:ABC-type transport system involved in multi-copper enzyme maturation permease subunit